MKIPILVTGLSGLVGSRINELLGEQFDLQDISLDTGHNIVHSQDVEKACEQSDAQVILHMAAKTDVDACEDDKVLGEEGAAWQVNVVGTENVVKAASKTGKRLIYISTDFVFDGTQDYYEEKDSPNPICWYGVTKYKGENIVADSQTSWVILRIAYPYKARCVGKQDFVHRLLNKMQAGEVIFSVIDHIFTPTFIDDIARSLKFFLTREFSGIYHVVGSQSLITAEAVNLISTIFHKKAMIKKATRSQYFRGRAFRPFKLRLKNAKIEKLGILMKRFDEGLITIQQQLNL